MVPVSGKDASWSLPWGDVRGMSSFEEAPRQTQAQVETLYLYTGLGTPRDPQSELVDVARKREVCCPLLKLLPL